MNRAPDAVLHCAITAHNSHFELAWREHRRGPIQPLDEAGLMVARLRPSHVSCPEGRCSVRVSLWTGPTALCPACTRNLRAVGASVPSWAGTAGRYTTARVRTLQVCGAETCNGTQWGPDRAMVSGWTELAQSVRGGVGLDLGAFVTGILTLSQGLSFYTHFVGASILRVVTYTLRCTQHPFLHLSI